MKAGAFLKRLKPFDWALLALSVAVTVLSASVYKTAGDAPVLVIETGGETWVYGLDHDETLHVKGAEGVTVVKIAGGKVSFTDSPCANKTCVASAAISRANEWIACLPNQVFAHIEGKTDDAGVDIISN